MLGSVSKFYLFITKRYNDFDRFKQAVDTNRNNVIQYNELRSFIYDNEYELSDVCNDNAINEIWSGLDTFVRGNNAYAEGNVSENGSLNAQEEGLMSKKIAMYGKFSNLVKNNIVFITNDSAFKNANLSAASLEAMVMDSIFAQHGDSIDLLNNLLNGNNQTILIEEIKNTAWSQTMGMFRDKITINMNQYVKDVTGYSLAKDEELSGLLNLYMTDNSTYNSGKSLSEISADIKNIIGHYIQTAAISVDDLGNIDSKYKYGENEHLNELQVAKLTKLYNDELKNYLPDGFDGFENFVNDAKKAYLTGILDYYTSVTQSKDFVGLYGRLSEAGVIIEEFNTSDEMKILCALRDGGYIDLAANPDAYQGNFDSDISNLFMNYVSDSAAFSSFYDEGTNSIFSRYLRYALVEISSNLSHYFNSMSEVDAMSIGQAILQYFEEHIYKILSDLGNDKMSVVDATYSKYDNANNNDRIIRAEKMVNYVKQAYKDVPRVMNYIKDHNLDNIAEYYSNDIAGLNTAIDGLYNEIFHYENNEALTPKEKDAIVSEFKSLVGTQSQIQVTSEWGWTTARDKVKQDFAALSLWSKLKENAAAVGCTEIDKVVETTKNYYNALISKMVMCDDGDHVSLSGAKHWHKPESETTWSFDYQNTITGESESDTVSDSVVQTWYNNTSEDDGWHGGSTSGFYVQQVVYNGTDHYHIDFDQNKLVDKFAQFMKMVL